MSPIIPSLNIFIEVKTFFFLTQSFKAYHVILAVIDKGVCIENSSKKIML